MITETIALDGAKTYLKNSLSSSCGKSVDNLDAHSVSRSDQEFSPGEPGRASAAILSVLILRPLSAVRHVLRRGAMSAFPGRRLRSLAGAIRTTCLSLCRWGNKHRARGAGDQLPFGRWWFVRLFAGAGRTALTSCAFDTPAGLVERALEGFGFFAASLGAE